LWRALPQGLDGGHSFQFARTTDDPLIRTSKGGKLRPASCDEALDRAVTKFKAIAERSG
jgi:hypothetical protein